jgi:GDPmannose 4,6-dehydratase
VDTTFGCFNLDSRDHVDISPSLLRPDDIQYSAGDPSPIQAALGWAAEFRMREVVAMMCDAIRNDSH